MANANLTPRQKMINMLYLVLTAILALNVSSEVLDAFKSVNDGITITNGSQTSKNNSLFNDLSRQYAIDSIRAKEAFVKAAKARVLSEKLNSLLEQYKQQLISNAGGIDVATGKIHRDDDIDVATHLFVENNGATGKTLKKEIEDTRNQLLALLNENDRIAVEKNLALTIDEPRNGETWEYARFNHIPAVAAVTLLSKFQNDVLSAENHVVQSLYNSINAKVDVVDKMEARVFSPSAYILQGDAYRADVMVAASNSTLVPDVFMGPFTGAVKKDAANNFVPVISKSDIPPLTNPVKVDVKDGAGKLNIGTNATGNKKYTGVVRVKNASTGEFEFYPFEGEYQVAPKMAVVSAKMMNIMYVGLDNAVDVSVPGVAQSDVTATLEGSGTLTKSADGNYMARLTAATPAKVIVKAKINGHEVVMGQQDFRVKNVPSPVTTLDGVYEGGKITLARIRSTKGVVPLLKVFEYPAKFTVLSYEVSYKSRKDDNIMRPILVEGTPLYNDKVKDIVINRVQTGDDVYFDNIRVKGPAGDVRIINPISFVIVK